MFALQAKPTVARASRTTTVKVTAQAVDRRAALGLLAGALLAAAPAQAIVQPSQEIIKRKGKNGTFASASSYGLEGFNTGTKKRGISPKEKAEVLEKAKERALEEAAKGRK